MAKFLFAPLTPNNQAREIALKVLTRVTMTNPKGTINNSANLAGFKEKATLEKSRAGVKNETFNCEKEKGS